MFSKTTKAIIYGLQLQAAEKMLDFDYISGRSPSVVAFVNPMGKENSHKIFYGDKEIIIKSYPSFKEIPENIILDADTVINFASHRSAFESTKEAMKVESIKNIVVIAEGIPERQVREIIELNKGYNKTIIGPSTVGAMTSGAFRAGNTGGSLENIISSKLYKPGSVGFVSKSGGMSNEMRKVIADRTNGTHTSVAIGGDRYYVSTFKDIIKKYEKNDGIKMIVLLGEVGGEEEIEIGNMIKNGKLKKPVCAYCIGTISDEISGEVQFGHAGAKANSNFESAKYKNEYLKKSGAIVPNSFIDFGDKIKETFDKLDLKNEEKTVNLDEKLEKIKLRKKTSFTSTISDERGEELTYNKKPISSYVNEGSIANVIGNLWLKRDLPEYAKEFIDVVIIILADHGPAVSGATNAIVTARGGNDLKSSLIAGLTTIGPRFGGAIDGAGHYFSEAVENNTNPVDFISEMKKKGIRIPGIGHKVKSKFNPDKRCELLLEIAKKFPSKRHLNFALEVEKLTLEKKHNLILNVDGMIASLLLDMFDDLGMDYKEKKEYIDAGIFNGFFILARSIGFIGHIIDQKRLKEGLHRTSWDDILYK